MKVCSSTPVSRQPCMSETYRVLPSAVTPCLRKVMAVSKERKDLELHRENSYLGSYISHNLRSIFFVHLGRISAPTCYSGWLKSGTWPVHAGLLPPRISRPVCDFMWGLSYCPGKTASDTLRRRHSLCGLAAAWQLPRKCALDPERIPPLALIMRRPKGVSVAAHQKSPLGRHKLNLCNRNAA